MNQPPPPIQPPAGYVYHSHLFQPTRLRPTQLAFWRLALRANLLALLPLGAGILLLWLPYQFYLHLGVPLARLPEPGWSAAQRLILLLLTFLVSIVLHEVIHGLAMRLAGHPPRFLFWYLVPLAGIRPGRFLTRGQYLLMALAPAVLMSLGGGASLLWLPAAAGQILLPVLLLNLAASSGDLYLARRVWLAPAEARFAAAPDILVFVPQAAGRPPAASKPSAG